MLILSGQGNPGSKYGHNRHNAGFMVLDRIHAHFGFGPWRNRFEAEVSEGSLPAGPGSEKVLLVKPQTFYNETGRSLSRLLGFYRLQPAALTVIYDEIDLAPGRVRVRRGGGHSGNNGIRSVMAHLGEEFRRVRIGIGHPGDKAQVMAHVLSDFHKADLAWFEPLTEAVCKALPLLVAGDDERFQTEVMRLAPAPRFDPRRPGPG